MAKPHFLADIRTRSTDVHTDHVRKARLLLKEGYSLQGAANLPNRDARALDVALWRYIDWSLAIPEGGEPC